MDFIEMRDLLNKHFDEVMRPQEHLFEVLVDKDKMWETYLNSFPKGSNEIFRKRQVHDCSCCRGFIKHIGNVVGIVNGEVISIWDFECNDPVYGTVVKAMSDFVHSCEIGDVFLSIESKIGCHHNFEELKEVGRHRWDHFFTELDPKHLTTGLNKGTVLNDFRTAKMTFKRALEEISFSAVDTLLELIADNSIYRGPEWEQPLNIFRKHKVEYSKITDEKQKDLYAWEQSTKLGRSAITGIRNTSMGTLLVDFSNGRDLEEAVRAYEKITDPTVYKHPKPIYTEKMRQDAEKKVQELGFIESLPRQFANLNHITVNDIMFVNRDRTISDRVEGASIFDELAKDVKTKPKKFDRVETIPVEKFIKDVLPYSKDIEVYVENKHKSNFVSLIAPKNPDSKSMFKWGNNFGWAYTGNLTDSFKEKVKEFGGNVEGALRFSIKWNESGEDNVDLDAHAILPRGIEIYFGDKHDWQTGGSLDVDIRVPNSQIKGTDKTAVENIVFPSKTKLPTGDYVFYVHQYSGNLTKGFRAEIEMDGEIYSFDYPNYVRNHDTVKVATVTLDRTGKFTIKPHIDSSEVSKTFWGINTNNFVPVTCIMYSPNYWENTEKNVGHKHLFFMLKNCVNDERPSGIFNEFLVKELDENKRVMAALSSKLRVEDTDDQLSGLGFAMDKRAELIVKVTGASERILKVQF